jgi:hypothetical protein
MVHNANTLLLGRGVSLEEDGWPGCHLDQRIRKLRLDSRKVRTA